MGQIRALDICTGLRDNRYDAVFENTLHFSTVTATAGGDSKADRCISIWDIQSGTLLKRLDNGSNKSIVLLLFHPQYPNLLLSADMDFDVKVWDWESGDLLGHWKKHHTRIIYKMDLVPGTHDM